jgi:hypothetical protein
VLVAEEDDLLRVGATVTVHSLPGNSLGVREARRP